MYAPIIQTISNHPGITLTRKVETEIFFKKDRILLFCRLFYVDANGQQVESIPEKLHTFSTFGTMVNPTTGKTVHKDVNTGEYPVGSMLYNDYLALIPNQLPGSSTTYGNISAFAQFRVIELDEEGEFN